jgi:hypothetical protein
MPRLKDYPWWPCDWSSPYAGSSAEVSRDGIFVTAILMRERLTIVAEYKGGGFHKAIAPSEDLDVDRLTALESKLNNYRRERISVIENLELDW